jgi:exonuclease III
MQERALNHLTASALFVGVDAHQDFLGLLPHRLEDERPAPASALHSAKSTMRLLSWNLAARSARAGAQVEWLASRSPEVVALQEVRPSARAVLRAALAELGLEHQVDTFDLGQDPTVRTGPRRTGLLIASRQLLEPIKGLAPAAPWPERLLSCDLQLPTGGVEVHTAHVPPGSSNGWIKVEVFEAIHVRIRRQGGRPKILCGDFNSPRAELPDGTVVTWGQRFGKDGRPVLRRSIRGQPGARWDAAERAVLCGLGEYGLRDGFRELHGYGIEAASWIPRGASPGRRFDHVFASRPLPVRACRYHAEPRLAGLSDHCPIEADFDI